MSLTLLDFGRNESIRDKAEELLMTEKYDECLKVMNEYVERHKYESEGYYYLGLTYLFLKKRELALNIFEEGYPRNRADQDILFGYGVASIENNDIELGEELLNDYFQKYQPATMEILGRASVIGCADMYVTAMVFLKIALNYKDSEGDKNQIKQLAGETFEKLWDYSMDPGRMLGKKRFMLDNMDIDALKKQKDGNATKEYLEHLFAESYWRDAAIFYALVNDTGDENNYPLNDVIKCLCHYNNDRDHFKDVMDEASNGELFKYKIKNRIFDKIIEIKKSQRI